MDGAYQVAQHAVMSLVKVSNQHEWICWRGRLMREKVSGAYIGSPERTEFISARKGVACGRKIAWRGPSAVPMGLRRRSASPSILVCHLSCTPCRSCPDLRPRCLFTFSPQVT